MEQIIDNGTIIYLALVTFGILAYVLEKIVDRFRR